MDGHNLGWLHPRKIGKVLCPCVQWLRVCRICLRFDRMEVCVLQSAVFVKTLLDGKSKGEVGLSVLVHHSVHRSCKEHDWLCLITRGLFCIVMMNQVRVLPDEFPP